VINSRRGRCRRCVAWPRHPSGYLPRNTPSQTVSRLPAEAAPANDTSNRQDGDSEALTTQRAERPRRRCQDLLKRRHRLAAGHGRLGRKAIATRVERFCYWLNCRAWTAVDMEPVSPGEAVASAPGQRRTAIIAGKCRPLRLRGSRRPGDDAEKQKPPRQRSRPEPGATGRARLGPRRFGPGR